MPVAAKISEFAEKASWIRRMFEEGIKLKQQFGEENVFDFSLGNPDIDPPVAFFDTAMDLLGKPQRGAHGYMPNPGFNDVREAMAHRVTRDHGIDMGGNCIIMSCGAAGGLNVVFKTILNPGDQVIVPKPYFAEYGFYISNHGGEMVLVDSNPDFSLNVDNIMKAFGERTRAVLINSPNNPTGKVYAESDIIALSKALAGFMEKTGRIVYLVADEPYREIVYDGIKVPSVLGHCDQSILVTSFSKTLSVPGERIGYIAVNPKCRGLESLLSGLILCTRILGFVNAPAFMQRAVARLADASVNVNIYRKRRDLLMEGLSFAGLDYAKPEGAFYIFCKSPVPDDMAFVRHLLKYNVLVVPGAGFGGPGYFRIAYCASESVINRALPKFKEAMMSFRP